MMRLRTACGAVWVAAALIAQPLAAAGTEGVRLDYQVAEGCPAAGEFEAEVRARTNKVNFGKHGRSFSVSVTTAESGYSGRLVITESDGHESARDLAGDACDEVVSGLALVAALAIDPDASTAPRSELTIAPPIENKPEPQPNVRPEPKPERKIPIAPAPQKPSSRPLTLEWAVGAHAELMQGPTPVALFSAGPEVELGARLPSVDPLIRLGFSGGQTGFVGADAGEARFRLLASRLEVCPAAWRARFRLLGCAVAEFGLLTAEGRQVEVPEKKTRAWIATGLEARAGIVFAQSVFVDVDTAGLVNLTRDEFVFEKPKKIVYEVPWASLFEGISLGVLLP